MANKSDGSTAAEILRAAMGHMEQRAATYDKPEGERSMGATVASFELVTGVSMTEEQGWLFMVLLKAVRSQQGGYRADSYEDGAAYFALAGESAAMDRNGGWTPDAIKATPAMPDTFGQQHMIDPASVEIYTEIDRLRTAEAFNADLPVPQREPHQPRHRCLACGGGHSTHRCGHSTHRCGSDT